MNEFLTDRDPGDEDDGPAVRSETVRLVGSPAANDWIWRAFFDPFRNPRERDYVIL